MPTLLTIHLTARTDRTAQQSRSDIVRAMEGIGMEVKDLQITGLEIDTPVIVPEFVRPGDVGEPQEPREPQEFTSRKPKFKPSDGGTTTV